MIPLYHWMLAEPHKDKVNMEKAILDAGMLFVRGEERKGGEGRREWNEM